MANPFTKAWKYLMALFSSKVDEYADPKVQIQQAIEDAQRQHQALSQQAAAVIGNQRQLEMKLSRQMSEVEKLQGMARQALVLADQKRAFHAQLVAIADDRGYAKGWAANKFREKYGAWPEHREVEPIPPTAAVINWVKSRAIAFAKGKRNG